MRDSQSSCIFFTPLPHPHVFGYYFTTNKILKDKPLWLIPFNVDRTADVEWGYYEDLRQQNCCRQSHHFRLILCLSLTRFDCCLWKGFRDNLMLEFSGISCELSRCECILFSKIDLKCLFRIDYFISSVFRLCSTSYSSGISQRVYFLERHCTSIWIYVTRVRGNVS